MMPELWQVLGGAAVSVLAWCIYWLVCDAQDHAE